MLLSSQTTLNCKGQIFDLSRPVVMGIVNLTPDSFYSASRVNSVEEALIRVGMMNEAGASIIDMGGVSTRPGAPEIPEEEERDRLIPCIEAVHSKFPEITISADTYRSRIADEALQAGASIINDVSAGVIDSAIIDVAKKWNAPYVLMHMQGRPGNMQKNPQYKDVVDDLMAFFTNRIEFLRGKGLRDIIIDPGFGFGKRLHHNYRLLHYLHVFQVFEVPILVGLSRKSMIHRPLDARPEEVLAETSALHLMALNQGAKILRVHDIDAAMRVVKLWDELQKAVKKEA